MRDLCDDRCRILLSIDDTDTSDKRQKHNHSTNMEEPPNCGSGITKQNLVEGVISDDCQGQRFDQDHDLTPLPSNNSTTEPKLKRERPNVSIPCSTKSVKSPAQRTDQDLDPSPSDDSTTEPKLESETPHVSIACSTDSEDKTVESPSQSVDQDLDSPPSNNSPTEPNSENETPNSRITCSAESVNKVEESTDIKEEVIRAIENKLAQLEDIPDAFANIRIECFSKNTQKLLCQALDPESHTQTDGGLTSDYMGFGEWIGLDPQFMRYLHRTKMVHKTFEVLGKWATIEGDPRPTIGNFKDCMINGIDRPDVVTDLAGAITKDAIAWTRTRNEACTVPQAKTDKSWQLTRHDVVTGRKTYYTACLVYADEDEGMALIITRLYKTVWKEALFFLPQFDLKIGKYVFDTTARVIQERCDGRVIFILSEYFFASEVCRFAVQFAKANDAAAEAGNLIPFHLTNKLDHVPTVLKGISGIRWFRSTARKMAWSTMTDTVLGGRIEPKKLETVRSEMFENIDREPSIYLCDPPYDEGIKPPGPPIEVNDSSHSGNDSITSDSEHYVWQETPEDLSVSSKTASKSRSFRNVRRIVHDLFNIFRRRKGPNQFQSTEDTDSKLRSHERSYSCGNSYGALVCSSAHKTHYVQSPSVLGDIKPLSKEKDKGRSKESVECASPLTHKNDKKTNTVSSVQTSDTQDKKGGDETRRNVSNSDEVNINFKQSDDEGASGCSNLVTVNVEFHRSRSEPVENEESIP